MTENCMYQPKQINMQNTTKAKVKANKNKNTIQVQLWRLKWLVVVRGR